MEDALFQYTSIQDFLYILRMAKCTDVSKNKLVEHFQHFLSKSGGLSRSKDITGADFFNDVTVVQRYKALYVQVLMAYCRLRSIRVICIQKKFVYLSCVCHVWCLTLKHVRDYVEEAKHEAWNRVACTTGSNRTEMAELVLHPSSELSLRITPGGRTSLQNSWRKRVIAE